MVDVSNQHWNEDGSITIILNSIEEVEEFVECVNIWNKILNLAKSAVWFVLCLLVGALTFEGVCSLTNRKEPAKEFSTTVFTKNGYDYLLVDTKHGVCVIHAESCPCHKNK